jgi:hypothetical protein
MLPVAVLAVAAASCTRKVDASADLEERIAQRASEGISKTLRACGLEPKLNANVVSVASKRISVKVILEESTVWDSTVVLAALFRLAIDEEDVPVLAQGAIGMGKNEEDAVSDLVSNWGAQFGIPSVFAIARQELGVVEPPSLSVEYVPFYNEMSLEGRTVFHGPVGIRGKAEDHNIGSDAYVEEVARLAAAEVPRGQPFATATILISVEGPRVTGGECRVDGEVSEKLFSSLGELSWSRGAPWYMYKLFFVFVEAD